MKRSDISTILIKYDMHAWMAILAAADEIMDLIATVTVTAADQASGPFEQAAARLAIPIRCDNFIGDGARCQLPRGHDGRCPPYAG